MKKVERSKRRRLMFEAVRDGVDVKTVAKCHGVTLATVYKACYEHGGCEYPEERPPRTSLPGTRLYNRILADLINTDELLKNIAVKHQMKVSRVGRIYRYAKKDGIPVRPR